MPVQLPPKARAETVRSRKHELIETIDWLGLWGLSLGFCALVLAAVADFVAQDNIGAALILIGAAAMIALILHAGTEPVDRG